MSSTGMTFAIAANEKWTADYSLSIDGAVAGMKFSVSGPSSVSLFKMIAQGTTTLNLYIVDVINTLSTNTVAFDTSASTNNGFVRIHLSVINGVNPGTINLMFASATNNQTNKILQGSYFTARKL